MTEWVWNTKSNLLIFSCIIKNICKNAFENITSFIAQPKFFPTTQENILGRDIVFGELFNSSKKMTRDQSRSSIYTIKIYFFPSGFNFPLPPMGWSCFKGPIFFLIQHSWIVWILDYILSSWLRVNVFRKPCTRVIGMVS